MNSLPITRMNSTVIEESDWERILRESLTSYENVLEPQPFVGAGDQACTAVVATDTNRIMPILQAYNSILHLL